VIPPGSSRTSEPPVATPARDRRFVRILIIAVTIAAAGAVIAALIFAGLTANGAPDPIATHARGRVAVVDVGVLVFREGLECILVLAAITASMTGEQRVHRQPVTAGAIVGLGASIATWFLVVGVVEELGQSVSALAIQAATGLLAVIVLLVVMNWFFHKIYWTGWIGFHTRRKRRLLNASDGRKRGRLAWGLALLGFTSLYREGFEVVLFLQSYRIQLGGRVVFGGVLLGVALAAIVGVLTFVGQHRLPYKKMLITTGVLLGVVLLVMVGEEAQEMQLAHWIPTTALPGLSRWTPSWVGLWFSVFPTVETLMAQALAGVLVFGTYAVARTRVART